MLNVKVKAMSPLVGDTILYPEYATAGSACVDLRACISEQVLLYPDEKLIIGTGLAFDPTDNEFDSMFPDMMVAGVIVPRSGLGTKHGIVLSNGTGIIDMDYRGEVRLTLWNTSDTRFLICPGDRLCQMMFVPVFRALLQPVEDFPEITDRGINGFGHTGVK